VASQQDLSGLKKTKKLATCGLRTFSVTRKAGLSARNFSMFQPVLQSISFSLRPFHRYSRGPILQWTRIEVSRILSSTSSWEKGPRAVISNFWKTLRLSAGGAATFRDFVAYGLSSGAGTDGFFEIFHALQDALYRPDFSDLEAEKSSTILP